MRVFAMGVKAEPACRSQPGRDGSELAVGHSMRTGKTGRNDVILSSFAAAAG